MICICGTELIWGGDHDYEDYGKEGEGIGFKLTLLTDRI